MGQICKMPNFKKNLLLFSHTCEKKKPNCMVMMPMKPSSKIVKFMVPGSKSQALGLGQYGHIQSDHAYPFTISCYAMPF